MFGDRGIAGGWYDQLNSKLVTSSGHFDRNNRSKPGGNVSNPPYGRLTIPNMNHLHRFHGVHGFVSMNGSPSVSKCFNTYVYCSIIKLSKLVKLSAGKLSASINQPVLFSCRSHKMDTVK